MFKIASTTTIVKLAFSNTFSQIPIEKEKIVADAIISTLIEDVILKTSSYATKSVTPLERIEGVLKLTKPSLLDSKEVKTKGLVGARFFFQGNITHKDLAKILLKAIKSYGNANELLKSLLADLQNDIGKNDLLSEIKDQIGIREPEDEFEEEDDESWGDSEDDLVESDLVLDFIDTLFQDNINLAYENISSNIREGQIVIDEQNIDVAYIENLSLSFEINRLNVGFEMYMKYDILAHRYVDEDA
jgi:hypothetical protein